MSNCLFEAAFEKVNLFLFAYLPFTICPWLAYNDKQRVFYYLFKISANFVVSLYFKVSPLDHDDEDHHFDYNPMIIFSDS